MNTVKIIGSQAAMTGKFDLIAPRCDEIVTLACAGEPRSDLGNAFRLVRRCRSFLRWNLPCGWLRRGSDGWQRYGATLQLHHAAAATVALIVDEAAAIKGGEQDVLLPLGFDGRRDVRLSDDLRQWAGVSQSASKLRAMSQLARFELHENPPARPRWGSCRKWPGG